MKKIISLIAATMMMFSFAAISHATEGDLTTAISNETVELNAEDATVAVKATFDFPAEVSIMGLQVKLKYNKTDLTLDSYTLTGEGLTWSTAASNNGADYGAYISFDDDDTVGCTPAQQYVMTLNFKVNDVTKEGTYPVEIFYIGGTFDSWLGFEEVYTVNLPEAGSISVKGTTPDPEPTTTTTSYFGANVNTAEKPSLAQILVYTFTTDEVGAARNTATKEIDLGTANFDTPTTIKTAAKVSGIPDGVTVGCSVAWK